VTEQRFHRGAWTEVDDLLVHELRDPMNLIAMNLISFHLARARGLTWDAPWQPADPQFESFATIAMKDIADALALHVRGDVAEAVDAALSAVEHSRTHPGGGECFIQAVALAVELALEVDDATAHDRLVAVGDGLLPLLARGHLARFAGRWAMRHDGDPPEVEEQLRLAVDHYDRWGSRVFGARAAADLGIWLVTQGRSDEGEPLLEAARSTFSDVGAAAWVAELEQAASTVG
jgi:hypothetical protein